MGCSNGLAVAIINLHPKGAFLILSEGSNWVIEGKKKLNYEAIGQVLVYNDLLKEDYLGLGEIKKGIACFEGDERLEPTCKKLGIEVFVL